MSILKSIEKEKVKFLMDFDYNNVLGRLKFVLGKDASFFADIRVRQNDITWSTKDNFETKLLSEASESEKQIVKLSINNLIAKVKNIIEKDALIGDFAKQITTYPSEEFVFFTHVNGEYKVVLTGWGFLEATKQSRENKNRSDINRNNYSGVENNQSTLTVPQSIMNGSSRMVSSTLKQRQKMTPDEFFINEHKEKNIHKGENEHSKIVIFKSIIFILLAAFIALIIPVFLTGVVNRLVADITGQWYLNGLSRVLITIFVAIFTYSVAYILIRFSILRKSIVFNIVCFILTFVWSAFMGIAWIPD